MTLREEWLSKARDLIIEQVFSPHELRFAPIVRISTGICPGKSVGVCCNPEFADDGAINIFITPEYGSEQTMEVLGTLTHELTHAHLFSEGYLDHGHGAQFKGVCKLVGLEGRPKSATAHEGTELWATLQGVAASLGEYPMGPLRKKPKKTRQSEMITYVSPTDLEYTVKLKFSQAYEKKPPRDYNDQPMVPADNDKFLELEQAYLEGVDPEQEAAE